MHVCIQSLPILLSSLLCRIWMKPVSTTFKADYLILLPSRYGADRIEIFAFPRQHSWIQTAAYYCNNNNMQVINSKWLSIGTSICQNRVPELRRQLLTFPSILRKRCTVLQAHNTIRNKSLRRSSTTKMYVSTYDLKLQFLICDKRTTTSTCKVHLKRLQNFQWKRYCICKFY